MIGLNKKQTKENSFTIFESETRLKGDLNFKDTIEIRGHFTGSIQTEGKIIIAEGANIKADMEASIIIVSGNVLGNCKARDFFEMTDGAYLKGNISAKSIKMADGVQFEGKCIMLQ